MVGLWSAHCEGHPRPCSLEGLCTTMEKTDSPAAAAEP